MPGAGRPRPDRGDRRPRRTTTRRCRGGSRRRRSRRRRSTSSPTPAARRPARCARRAVRAAPPPSPARLAHPRSDPSTWRSRPAPTELWPGRAGPPRTGPPRPAIAGRLRPPGTAGARPRPRRAQDQRPPGGTIELAVADRQRPRHLVHGGPGVEPVHVMARRRQQGMDGRGHHVGRHARAAGRPAHWPARPPWPSGGP